MAIRATPISSKLKATIQTPELQEKYPAPTPSLPRKMVKEFFLDSLGDLE